MKKRTALFLFLCCMIISTAFSQSVSELYQQLSKAKTPVATIDIYNRIAYQLRAIDPDSAIKEANRSLQLAKENNYENGEGTALLCLSYANIAKAKYELSNDYAKKAKVIAENKKNDSLLAYSLVAIGVYNYNTSNYDNAIDAGLKAVKIFEAKQMASGVIKSKVMMSQVYQLKNDLPRAEKLLQETLPDIDEINEPKVKVNVLHTLANIYGMQEKYKEALAIDKQGIDLCSTADMRMFQSEFFDNMANCYMYSQRYDEAKEYFLKSLLIDSSFDNKKQMADTWLNLGNLSLLQKKYSDAKNNLLHAVALADSSGYRQGKYQALFLLSDAYKQSNDPTAAMNTLNSAYSLKDSIINEQTENKIAELETVYQSEKKEAQLKLQQAELIKKNFLLWGAAAGLVLLLLSGFTFYRKRQAQNKLQLQAEVMKQQDMATKAVIVAEENERKRIAADLHDGVGQMMSAAKMNLSAFENDIPFKDDQQKNSFEKIISLVDESCKEIRSVSHQMMPNALLKSGLASAVKEFIDKIDSRILKINLYTEGLNERLDGNVETVLYRVIQECVNNVIKHSGANSLDISLIKDADGIAATIEDNGKGFNSKDKEKFEGIGLKNISSRIGFLKGTVDFDSSPGNGTLVAIHVPLV
ncbi:tetratricopeptide repeat-containing sensor histidine kinase [Ferruginibacter sp. SUN106]|uniref:tetratricopeptide repeat-containing sensor histidine kinase n=1 Tax=Ferruginibacter sp. SUN106 TaxID=2978348 RepID=UPI003D35C395